MNTLVPLMLLSPYLHKQKQWFSEFLGTCEQSKFSVLPDTCGTRAAAGSECPAGDSDYVQCEDVGL